MKEYQKDVFNIIEKFHSDNIFLPTRIIYFGNETDNVEVGEEVNSTTVSKVIKNLYILDNLERKDITLLLCTPGGSWEDGMAIYDTIKSLKSNVIIIGMGKVYSMGSVIIQAGYKRILAENSLLMIHNGTDGYHGDAKAFEAWGRNSAYIRQRMYEIYYENMSKIDKFLMIHHIEEMCSHDKIFTAQEAVDIGLADEILKKEK